MAKQGGFWGVVAAVIDALVRAAPAGSNGGTGTKQPKTPLGQPSTSGQPKLRSTAKPQRTSAPGQHHQPSSRAGVGDEAASPGQFGVDATRDLTQAEIAGLAPSYEPNPDGDPDPGEVVWTWVPYAEHDGRGKDRPVLIIARLGAGVTAGCYLSTKEHRGFISVGSGAWDSQGRESFLSPERVLRVSDGGMRREGHVLGADAFGRAIEQLQRVYPMRG